MTEGIRIECPHCATKLKAKNPSVFGKKIRCPKCAEPFVAEAPPPAGEDEFLDNLGSLGKDGGDDFGETLPSSRKLPAAPMRPKRGRKAGAGQDTANGDGEPPKKRRPRATDQQTMPLLVWPLFGLGGGMVAGLIWVVVGYHFHREVGYIAWAVGLCVGLGVRLAAGDRTGFGAGLMAIALSIFVILGCKFTVAYLWTAEIVQKISAAQGELTEDGAKRLLAMQVAEEEGAKAAKIGGKHPDQDWSEIESFQGFPKEIRAETERRWKKMPAAERTEVMNGLKVVQQLPRGLVAVFGFIGSFRLLDILWFTLASVTAFRVGSGASRNN
jgi:hypothetical protein